MTASTTWTDTAHGKGRVKLRDAQVQRGDTTVPRLAAVAHSYSENGERDSDPPTRFSPGICSEWLPRTTINTILQEYKARDKFRRGEPILLVGLPFAEKLINKWSINYLHQASRSNAKPWDVFCSNASKNRFYLPDLEKNVYGTRYHVREPETRGLGMGLPDFIECYRKWTMERVFLQQQVAAVKADYSEKGDLFDPGEMIEFSTCVSTKIAKDVLEEIDWRWIHNIRKAAGTGRFMSLDLQVLGHNSLLPLKYQVQDRLIAQVRGRQRVLLCSPRHAMHGTYPFPVHHTYDKYAMIDTENIDSEQWPKAGEVEGLQCILQPGDVLFVPQYWSMAVQGLEDEIVGLEIYLGERTRSPDAAELQISRFIEFTVADLEGMDDVKHWLGVIARAEELEWIDLSTLRGFRRIQMTQSVRDVIEDNLGSSATSEFLLAMCESRLNPTPWLNKVRNRIGLPLISAAGDFREPLYLLDKPVWHEDDRTEEEKNYPEFFRKTLEERGWKVKPTESTLRIPGYNTPNLS